ncbi:hypothetical protein QBC35DRAFT_31168 [Podospora australis]|uniref:Uncharacterized protein n=1 Tax=Podospora australis TaxID=1536484 RepID=A0AAN6WNW1_9PEZI|nr:hypothetical protein QBC35DRAFT_31168 [Podospora australis]
MHSLRLTALANLPLMLSRTFSSSPSTATEVAGDAAPTKDKGDCLCLDLFLCFYILFPFLIFSAGDSRKSYDRLARQSNPTT